MYTAGGTGFGALCTRCPSGTTDADTAQEGRAGPCQTCAVGQYAAAAVPLCTNCTVGSTDDDGQSSTACIECLAGYYAETSHSAACIACAAGRFGPTDGGSSATVCEMCGVGQYSGTGSNACICVFCSAGTADADSDASTPSMQPVSYRHVRTRDATSASRVRWTATLALRHHVQRAQRVSTYWQARTALDIST